MSRPGAFGRLNDYNAVPPLSRRRHDPQMIKAWMRLIGAWIWKVCDDGLLIARS